MLFFIDDDYTIQSLVLFCVSDAASNMKKTVEVLQQEKNFEKMLHVTCLAHALHNVTKEVMKCYDEVDSLIFAVKRLLVRSHKRCTIFKRNGKKLPPFPITTRYGSCVKAVGWYADDANFEHLKESVRLIKRTAKGKRSEPLRAKCDKVLNLLTSDVQRQVKFVNRTYSFIVEAIVKLEKRQITSVESYEIFEEVVDKFSALRCVRMEIKKKLTELRMKNTGYLVLLTYFRDRVISGPLELWNEDELGLLLNAVLTSTEIERVFSVFNAMLRKNRKTFNVENFSQYIIAKWFMQIVSLKFAHF